jgi:hypothetical protein
VAWSVLGLQKESALQNNRLSSNLHLSAACICPFPEITATAVGINMFVLLLCRVTSDPKLKALLSLIPSSMEASILQQYSLLPTANTSSSTSAVSTSPSPPQQQVITRRALLADSLLDDMAPVQQRSLLQANGTNGTTSSPAPLPSPSPIPANSSNTTATAMWTYLSDYDVEAPLVNDVASTSGQVPAMNYTTEQQYLPDGGNAVQDWLPLNNSILTYQGGL